MSGNRCVKGKEDYAVLLPFAGTLGMSEGGRQSPIRNPASAGFLCRGERQLLPKVALKKCTFPNNSRLSRLGRIADNSRP